jgi:hypothetical protein
MAKRYHQSIKDRVHEGEGEMRRLRDEHERAMYRHMNGSEHYAGMEPRRRQEMRDAGMLNEDHRAVANMPQDVKYHPYPKPDAYLPEGLDDTLRGIDRQIDLDYSRSMKSFHPKKV